MSHYQATIDKVSRIANLDEAEKKILQDYVFNCIGTIEEEYLPNTEYYQLHEDELKPIIRKLKDNEVFGTLIKVLTPLIKKGLF